MEAIYAEAVSAADSGSNPLLPHWILKRQLAAKGLTPDNKELALAVTELVRRGKLDIGIIGCDQDEPFGIRLPRR
jgi:hypothetical protein